MPRLQKQGAATSVLLATSPLLTGVGGRYFEDCHEADVVPQIVDGLYGVRDYALDPGARPKDRLPDAARHAARTSPAELEAKVAGNGTR